MKEFIAGYTNENEKDFNTPLITGSMDRPLHECVIDSLRSMEVIDNIKIVTWDYTEDPMIVNDTVRISTRKKAKNKRGKGKDEEDQRKYVPLKDSDNGQLSVKFKLWANDGETEITKNFLIPYRDENGYLYSKGKRFYMMYQLLDASTYVRENTVVQKALMPLPISRNISRHSDIHEFEWVGKTYGYHVGHKKEADVLLFYFAKWGMGETFKFFGVDEVIWLSPKPMEMDKYNYFKINKNIYLAVDKKAMKFPYVMSIVLMTLNLVTNRLRIEDVNDIDFWLEKLGIARGGNVKTYDIVNYGRRSVESLERNLNKETRDVLKLYDFNKETIFHVIRWMIQNYSALRSKDDLSLDNKRIRRNEYIASLLTHHINDRLHRIINMGDKLKLENLLELFNFPSNYLVTALHLSGLMRFDERVNDLDFISKLNYTTKGPNSLSYKKQKTMGLKFRNAHPSYLGNIDLSVNSSSDPGSSGMFTPFAKTYGMYFSDKMEPQEGIDDFNEFLKDIPSKPPVVEFKVAGTGETEEE